MLALVASPPVISSAPSRVPAKFGGAFLHKIGILAPSAMGRSGRSLNGWDMRRTTCRIAPRGYRIACSWLDVRGLRHSPLGLIRWRRFPGEWGFSNPPLPWWGQSRRLEDHTSAYRSCFTSFWLSCPLPPRLPAVLSTQDISRTPSRRPTPRPPRYGWSVADTAKWLTLPRRHLHENGIPLDITLGPRHLCTYIRSTWLSRGASLSLHNTSCR